MRDQMKWFALACAAVAAVIFLCRYEVKMSAEGNAARLDRFTGEVKYIPVYTVY